LPDATPARKPITILIVDDDNGVTVSYARMLSLDGYDVRTAVSGEAGLAEAEASRPDLIFVDLYMPIVDGLTFLRQLRALEHLRDTPVAIITGVCWFDDDISDELTLLGAKVYFKPLWTEDLVSIAKTLVEKRD
jgi:CheY-like chemotaxis protein